MFGVNDLIQKLNSLIATGDLTETELAQASDAIKYIENEGIFSVQSYAYLPNPVTNKGRFVYIVDESRYVFSNGESWDINSLIRPPSDINLWSWGNNDNYKIGDFTQIYRSSPVSVVGGFTDWVSASAGYQHTLGIRSNGTLWAWGSNNAGQLGDNTTSTAKTPTQVIGGFTDWIDVSAGNLHSLGVRANGTVWSWGNNTNGVLGNGTTTPTSSPIQILSVGWKSVSAGGTGGGKFSFAISGAGRLVAWGNNNNGRLGDGTTINKSTPVLVSGGFTDWLSVSGGGLHSVGLRANGRLMCWGVNGDGQCGVGNDNTPLLVPSYVVGGFTDWISASAGDRHNVGLRANGSLWAWGVNGFGRLGDGTITNRVSPVSVVGGFTDWVSASAGHQHSIGVRANGTLWAWGLNSSGQLGDDTVTNTSSPVSVVGGFTDWISVHAGSNSSHSLGIRTG